MNKIENFMHKFSFYFTEQAAGRFLAYGILPEKERGPFVSGFFRVCSLTLCPGVGYTCTDNEKTVISSRMYKLIYCHMDW